MRKIRILFLPLVDAANLNAQSLNTREIVLRLDPGQFACSLFYTQEPDPRLLNRPHISLLRLPARLKTVRLLWEMFAGHDIIAYMDYSPASYLYLHSPKSLRKRSKAVMHVEGLSELANVTQRGTVVVHRCNHCPRHAAVVDQLHRPRFLPWQLESYINGVHTFNVPQTWLFAIFPWCGFAFVGLAFGLFLFSDFAQREEVKALATVGTVGVIACVLSLLFDYSPIKLYAVYDYLAQSSPNFFLMRCGIY